MDMFNKSCLFVLAVFLISFPIEFMASDNFAKEMDTNPEIEPTIYQVFDFDMNPDLEIREDNNIFSLIVKKWLDFGQATRYFCGETAKYKITIYYLDHFLGEPSIDVYINDKKVGTIEFHKPKDGKKDLFTEREKYISGINIQKWSNVTFKIKNDVTKERTEKLHMQRFVFTPIGPFEGEISDLNNPEPLRIFESIAEQRNARGMLSKFLDNATKPLYEKRKNELEGLKTPEEWKERKKNILSRLHEFFGEFPAKTPLNASIVGTIERDKYIIEKLIFESQPNYFCSANFYVPKTRSFPVPGVLVTIGHKEEGKSRKMYHECCLGLVLKGYVVLALDPMGQGERSEYFNEKTKENLIERAVDQHHYVGRPAYLTNWTLSTIRTWDCIRAVDYLVSRSEVDTSRLAVVGNSGGGQMAMQITAVDKRIKVCAAGHPGGSCESMLLNGSGFPVSEIYSLIAPRPFRVIIGRDSGEEEGHRRNINDMKVYYRGFGVREETCDISIVDGKHDIKKPKREAVYEWLNKWLDKKNEGNEEPPLHPEKIEDLWCTENGFTLLSLGGETAQSLNAMRADRIYQSEKDLTKLKERISARIGLINVQKRKDTSYKSTGTYKNENYSVEKIIIKGENSIDIPAILMKQRKNDTRSPLILHMSDKGKPTKIGEASVPISLVNKGFNVLSIDVRGIGETDRSPQLIFTPYTGRLELQWLRDILAIESTMLKRTMLGMRTLDVIYAIDFVKSRQDIKNKSIVLIGEGLGGLWALLAAAYDSRTDGVICIGTLPSYLLLLKNKYYNVRNYFWVPGALADFDIPDLTRLISPQKQLWINPINALAESLKERDLTLILERQEGMQFVITDDHPADNVTNKILKYVE
jgi:cephalosporin-C deacetylase-like acetyl esterase